VDTVYVSAISAFCGSAIGAFASLATTWLTHRHQDERRRRAEKNARLARIFEEFIDLSSTAFDLHTKPAVDRGVDIVRWFVETCRAELRRYQQ
jgi:hypothetical protein